jgi:hypothetical protein
MTFVVDIAREHGFDMTLNAELIIGVEVAMVHLGTNDYGSGFLIVRYTGGEDDLFRPIYSWRILDNYADSVDRGNHLVHLDGGTHPLDLLLVLVQRLRHIAQDEPDGADALGNWHWGEDEYFWLVNYISRRLAPTGSY